MKVNYTLCDVCKRKFDKGDGWSPYSSLAFFRDTAIEKREKINLEDICPDCSGLISIALNEILNPYLRSDKDERPPIITTLSDKPPAPPPRHPKPIKSREGPREADLEILC